MTEEWPTVPIGRVLTRSQEWVGLVPDRTYRQLTVRLKGLGVVQRNEVTGAEIAGERRLVARAGQLVLSKIDARNGAIGIVPVGLDGAVVSTDFPVFALNPDRVIPEYLGWLTRTRHFVSMCGAASEGTTNRVRLKEDRFLALPIPLPPLADQRRIVAHIEAVAGRVEEARRLTVEAEQALNAAVAAATERAFMALARDYEPVAFGDLRPHVTSGPRNWSANYSRQGHRFYRAQDIGRDGRIANGNVAFVEPPMGSQGASAFVKPQDLLIVITGATVGRCAVFTGETEAGFVNQHVAICRLPPDVVVSTYALWGLRSPFGQRQLLGQRYGQGKPGLNLTNIRTLRLPLPPLETQNRIAAELDGLSTNMEVVEQLQVAATAELDALLPAVLDRAFGGIW